MRRLAGALALVLISAPTPGLAQSDWLDVAQATAPRDAWPVGGFAVSGRNGTWRHDIYSRFVPFPDTEDGLGFGHFAIRKSLNNPEGIEQIVWADEETCPQVLGVMRALDAFQPPQIDIWGLRRRIPAEAGLYPAAPGPDGNSYAIWVKAQARTADGAFTDLTIAGGAGLIKGFVEFAEGQLAACWSRDIPPGFERSHR